MEAVVQQAILVEYEGARSAAGLPHGAGAATFASGLAYSGAWRSGAMHGAGKLTFPCGTEYEGSVCDNAIDGRGVRRAARNMCVCLVEAACAHAASAICDGMHTACMHNRQRSTWP